MDINGKSFLFGAFVVSILYEIAKWISDKKGKKKEKKQVDDCLFFSPRLPWDNCSKNLTSCRNTLCSNCSYNKLIDLIMKAETHLDVCVYLITCEGLMKHITHVFRKGVFVRIITDKQMSEEANCSVLVRLMRDHLPIKTIKTSVIMHNKFVIIDKKKLVTGSFNWTKQGLMGNFENGVVISNEETVKKYMDYFDNCWYLCD